MRLTISRQIFSFLGFLLVLSGCSSSLPDNYPFFKESETGTVVFGLQSLGQAELDLRLAAQNDDGTITALIGQEKVHHKSGEEKTLHLVQLRPGFYVFKSVAWTEPGYPRSMDYKSCLSAHTYRFEVTADQVHYVGDLRVETKANGVSQLDLQGFTELTDVQAEIDASEGAGRPAIKAPLVESSFPRGRDVFGMNEACGGYYQKPEGQSPNS